VRIGRASAPIRTDSNAALIPNVSSFFFPAQSHLVYLERILSDYSNWEHILLIGNQGVGKNVLTDVLLQCVCHEREYVQLHRDTTVMTLTLQPSLIGGTVIWQDSPLVRSVIYGRTLLLDELDKVGFYIFFFPFFFFFFFSFFLFARLLWKLWRC
jgi:midasin (ATPase involved in ribosome maturation)